MQEKPIGRLALRQEGDHWNAYYALPGTMDDAVPLASIRMTAVLGRAHIKNGFMALMREVVADILEEQTGVRPTWPTPPAPAPEHERAGNA